MSKIILSRKGYDDQYGGKPSIILPDGKMLSFPIPILDKSDEKGLLSDQLTFGNKQLSDYFVELGHNRTNLKHHVDPDIYGLAGSWPMGTFGQSGAALSHLRKEEVKKGDVFLFFGTFCFTYSEHGKLQYERMHPFHAIFGYLVVDEIVTINKDSTNLSYEWLESHPHFQNRGIGEYAKNNAIYIGRDFGYFRYSPVLQLTKPGYHKSYWQLPLEFKGIKLSYHNPSEQRINGAFIEFSSVAKGQEFVLEKSDNMDQWIGDVLKHKIG